MTFRKLHQTSSRILWSLTTFYLHFYFWNIFVGRSMISRLISVRLVLKQTEASLKPPNLQNDRFKILIRCLWNVTLKHTVIRQLLPIRTRYTTFSSPKLYSMNFTNIKHSSVTKDRLKQHLLNNVFSFRLWLVSRKIVLYSFTPSNDHIPHSSCPISSVIDVRLFCSKLTQNLYLIQNRCTQSYFENNITIQHFGQKSIFV